MCPSSIIERFQFDQLIVLRQLWSRQSSLLIFVVLQSCHCFLVHSHATQHHNNLEPGRPWLYRVYLKLTILVVINCSKPMCPAVCSGEDRGFISQTAAGNWAYFNANSVSPHKITGKTLSIQVTTRATCIQWTCQLN